MASIGKTATIVKLTTFSMTIMKLVCAAKENCTAKYNCNAQMNPEHGSAILSFSSDFYKTNMSNPLNSARAFDALSLVSSKTLPSTLLRKKEVNRHDFSMKSRGYSCLTLLFFPDTFSLSSLLLH